MNGRDMTRRDALVMTGSAALTSLQPARSGAADSTGLPARPARPPLTLFSRHLHWAGVEEAIEVTASAGFGGIAWTVRPGAHIAPANVARDLPRAVELTHRAGLNTPLLVTGLRDAESPYAEAIVETAAGLGIRIYRGQIEARPYDFSGDVPAQLETLRPAVAGLVRLNERYGATALVHTHGGMLAGAVWDTWLLLRDFDPDRIGINFDTGYGAMWAGRGWMEAVRFARPYIRSLSLKDFRWRLEERSGRRKWSGEICVPGQGMVDFQEMLGYFQTTGFHGPAEVQFEYPIEIPGRATALDLMAGDVGQLKLAIPKADFIALLKRDADFYGARLRETRLEPI
jgi:sugar phosphate isomerase/epimerase